jgi:hypothetical protein
MILMALAEIDQDDGVPVNVVSFAPSIFFHFPRRLHVLQTFCAAKCRSGFASLRQRVVLASISLRRRLFIFLSGTKVLLLRVKMGVSGGGVRP